MATRRQGILLIMALLLASGSGCSQITSKPPPRITAPPINKKWQDPTVLGSSRDPSNSNPINTLQNPRVAMSAHGDAVVTWTETLGGNSLDIHASNFTPPPRLVRQPGTWSADTTIGTSDTQKVRPEVAMDDQGNALTVWHQNNYLYKNTHRQGTGPWGTASALEFSQAYEFPGTPNLAMNRSGEAIIVWKELNRPFPYPLTSIIYVMGSGFPWDGFPVNAPTQVDASTGADYFRDAPRVALDPRGQALAVWLEGLEQDIAVTLYVNYNYRSAAGWGRPSAVSVRGNQHGVSDQEPQVALDGQGNGLAVWTNLNKAFARRFTPGAGGQWEGQPQEISAPGTGNAGYTRVAMQQAPDKPGQGVAVWTQGGSIYARRFDPAAGGWEEQPHVLSAPGGLARNPAIAMGPLGYAVAVWIQQTGGEDNVFASHFTPGYGWGAPVALKTASGNTSLVDVAILAGGGALAAWEQFHTPPGGPTRHAIFARFYAGPIQ